MKEQQFEQQVKILREHHKNIQIGIQEQIHYAEAANRQEAQAKADQVSLLTQELFNYCEKLLHVSHQQSLKCVKLKKRLTQVFEKNKLSAKKMKYFEEKLEEADKKIEELLIQNAQLQLANKSLKAELKLSGVVTSFTFKDQQQAKKKGLKSQNQQISNQSSISGSEQHETSLYSQNSEVGKVQLYVSLLQQLNNDMEYIQTLESRIKPSLTEELNSLQSENTSNQKDSKRSVELTKDARQNREIDI